ncbi:hypothetical protein ACTA71_012298 [Dictyostelium dimigraforme]
MTSQTLDAEIVLNKSVECTWNFYTKPEHITKWNTASETWHCPSASNDLRVGGQFISRLEAKDGSMGFDFEGVYDEISQFQLIKYTMTDGRNVTTTFTQNSDQTTTLRNVYDPDTKYPLEFQKQGNQCILNSFKKYVESF